MKTAITELFGIEHPIIQGGMHFVGFAELAAAVSNAGGLGIITGLTQKTPELLAKEIARCRDMTDKPFGVNLTFLPAFSAPPYPEYIAAIVEGGIKAVETAGRSPEQYMPALKAAGIESVAISFIHAYANPTHELKVQKKGRDACKVVELGRSGEVFELEEQLAETVRAFERGAPRVSAEEARKRIVVCLEAERSVAQGSEIALRL